MFFDVAKINVKGKSDDDDGDHDGGGDNNEDGQLSQ